ncbi:MAG: prepilin peptidase [Actinobacteria bacterium]|nr:prepilin peptidase [Actinomycetota bacterium]
MVGFVIAVCFVLGLIVGSFLNVVIHRVPRNESVVSPRSACPSCGTEITNRDNVPVLSWLVLRGRCRSCGEAISARYPLVELLTGVIFALVGARLGADWALPAFLVFSAGLIALSAIDLDTYLLPRKVVYPTLFATAALLLVAAAVTRDTRGLAEATAGGVIGFVIFYAIHFASPKGMGFGDVRLAGVIGMALGWIQLPLVGVGLFLAFLLATIIGVGLMLFGGRSRKDKVPFGPFLAAGAMLALLAGQPILEFYEGYFSFNG